MKRVELIKYRGDKSQADMAKHYKVSQQAWSSWENGDKKPDVATMKQIERDSGIPMETLFFDVFNILSGEKEKHPAATGSCRKR